MKVKAVCEACKGTGLYQGMAEKGGCAVVCSRCKGTGCVELKYEPFEQRKHRDGIKRVFKSSFGYFHFVEDNRLANGDVVRFSQGGCTYEEWLNGAEPKLVKDLYCPYQWTEQMLQCEDVNGLYKTRCRVECLLGRNISDCRYFPGKAECWGIYEGDTPSNTATTDLPNDEVVPVHPVSVLPNTLEKRLKEIEANIHSVLDEMQRFKDFQKECVKLLVGEDNEPIYGTCDRGSQRGHERQ